MSNPTQRCPENETRLSDELRLIPRWAIAGALLAFALTQYYFWIVLPAHRHHPSSVPFALRFYLDLSWGALAALYVLSTRLWMVCILIPGGIGAVLYFLLRQPITASCPSCGAHIEGNYHYCPQCAYQVAACCSNCYRSARLTDIFCVHCGHDLTASHPPSRLHAFTR
jgi:hypothetical protein